MSVTNTPKQTLVPFVNDEDLDEDKSRKLAVSFVTAGQLPNEHMDLRRYVGKVRRNLKIEAKVGEDDFTKFQGVALILDSLSSAIIVKGLLDKWIIENLAEDGDKKRKLVDGDGKVLSVVSETYPKYLDLVVRLSEKFYAMAEENMNAAGGKRKGKRSFSEYGRLFLQIEEDKRKLLEEEAKLKNVTPISSEGE